MVKSAHAAPHGLKHVTAPATGPKAKPRGRGAIVTLVAAGAVAAVVGVWALVDGGPAKVDPTETLLEQMHFAAAGNVVATHAFGGGLAVTHGNGRTNVTAEGLPGKACVQVGWHLAKEGTIIVNGILPARLSAAKLSELCSDREGGAALTWVPDETAR